MKEPSVKVELDNDSAILILNGIADVIPENISDDELSDIIRFGFYIDATSAPGADGVISATWKETQLFSELVPALRAGSIDFGAFKSRLKTEFGIRNESNHKASSDVH